MSGLRDRLSALYASSLDLRELRYTLEKDPGLLAALSDAEVDRLYQSIALGRYSLSEACRVVERFQMTRTKGKDDGDTNRVHDGDDGPAGAVHGDSAG